MAKKPAIANVWWRGEIAWGRVERGGRTIRESLETTDPRVARERVQKWLKDLEAQQWGEKPRRTFDEAADKYLDYHLPRLKPGARRRYLQSLKLLAAQFEGKHLDEIKSGMLSDFEQKRRRDGVTSGTILNDLTCLSSIFTCAEEWEWIEGNPVAAYVRSRSKRQLLNRPAPRTRYLSHDEEDELMERCRGRRQRWDGAAIAREDHIMLLAAMVLTIDIGLRKEELMAADWTMIDLDRKEWTVPKELAKTGRKRGVGRTVPILPRSLAVLRALPRAALVAAGANDPLGRKMAPFVLWHEHEEGQGRRGPRRYSDLLKMLQDIATGGRSYVFRREASKLAAKQIPLTPARRADIAIKADREAWADVIPDLIWHDLRRTCGCRLLQDHGMEMSRVSKWLGHASIEQTERAYAFLEVKHLHAAVRTGLAEKARHRRSLAGPEAIEVAVTKPVTPKEGG